jgi:predicted alpha/beta superfamily hydrolase
VAASQKRGWFVRPFVWLLTFLGIAYVTLLASLWNNRVEFVVSSAALGEARSVTVFAPAQKPHAVAIYALDGDRFRNGLLLATNAAIVSTLRGQPRPVVIAIHSGAARDRDFRPPTVSPASWRPNTVGRSPSFDVFLIEEARTAAEARFEPPKERWLFGHSLGGFYALDMPTRRQSHGFSAVYAFSPTFSHDLTLIDRLDMTCKPTSRVYANIGIESRRDTDVFARARKAFVSAGACREKVTLSRHFGVLHQAIMLTGQVEALFGLGHSGE